MGDYVVANESVSVPVIYGDHPSRRFNVYDSISSHFDVLDCSRWYGNLIKANCLCAHFSARGRSCSMGDSICLACAA